MGETTGVGPKIGLYLGFSLLEMDVARCLPIVWTGVAEVGDPDTAPALAFSVTLL